MGSRGRSIRLRIYFLVAIPLITMLGLFGYVAYTSITNWQNLDRAPSLIRATSVPLTNFVSLLQAERRAAVVYASHPDTANRNAYENAIMTTRNGELPLMAAISSHATRQNATADETAAINKMVADVNGMTGLRTAVAAKKLAALDAFAAYTKIITDQDTVFQAEANSMTNASASTQGLGLISAVNAREDLDEQDAVLAGALASGSLAGPDRVAFGQAAGRQQDDTLLFTALLTPSELAVYNRVMNSMAPMALQNDLTTVQQAVMSDVPLKQMEQGGLTPPSWEQLTRTWGNANYQATTQAANAVLEVDQRLANDAHTRLYVTAAVGVIGLILTLLVTILLGRSINRRLTTLRRSALTLAEEQLPAVVARLRRGENVDVAAEAPPLRVGSDEIGQVGQAIDTVRQTAIRSAVDEARLRQGVNDMFRNLARRNQSLLQRQLTVLDGMERRATDPDVLEDLFKMDHLTTRMRRHAEGLIILSGAPPGRGWSAPVKLIDVMRGAVAEVEDYARVAVATQSKAALAGSAVTDVIHLLAELIENATTLSPPSTQVRVSGESVGNGFAIEIEDRGLGMTPQRLAELNERLVNPPDINPTNTEQLGLFVVGQLARRHGINVTLSPSPYGGTTAVTLIPQRLIVDEGPAAITAGGPGTATAANGSYGAHGSYGPNGANGTRAGFAGNGAPYQPYGADGSGLPLPSFTPSASASAPAAGGPPDLDSMPLGGYRPYGGASDPAGSNIRIPGALRHPGGPADAAGPAGTGSGGRAGAGGAAPGASPGGRRGRHGAAEVPVVTGVPVTRPSASAAPPFDVFTPLHRAEPDGQAPSGVEPRTGPGGPDAPYAQSYPASYPGTAAQESYTGVSYGQASYGAGSYGNNDGDGGGSQEGDPAADGSDDYKGLPRRVRQANLAPQLRSSAAAGSTGSTGVPQAAAPSLTDMRNTLSAMQRGWQQGRSQAQRNTEGSVDGD